MSTIDINKPIALGDLLLYEDLMIIGWITNIDYSTDEPYRVTWSDGLTSREVIEEIQTFRANLLDYVENEND